MRRAIEHGFTEPELRIAIDNIKASIENQEKELDKDYIDSIVERCEDHILDNSNLNNPNILCSLKKHLIKLVDLEDCQKWIKELITDENKVFIVREPSNVKTPTTEQTILDAVEAAEQAPIAPYELRTVDRPLMIDEPTPGSITEKTRHEGFDVTTYTLSNGMKVSVKPNTTDEDQIIIKSITHHGLLNADIDTLPAAQLSDMVAQRSGIAGLSPTELRQVLAGRSGHYSRSINDTKSAYTAITTKKDLETFFQLQHLTFTQPGQRKEPFDEVVRIVKEALSNADNDPKRIFSRQILEHNNSGHHHFKKLTLADIDKATYEDSIEHYKQIFSNPANFHTVIVGNIDPTALEPLIEKYLASIPTTPSTLPTEPHLGTFPAGITYKPVYAGERLTLATRLTFPTTEQPGDISTLRHRLWLTHTLQHRIHEKLRNEQEKRTQYMSHIQEQPIHVRQKHIPLLPTREKPKTWKTSKNPLSRR